MTEGLQVGLFIEHRVVQPVFTPTVGTPRPPRAQEPFDP